MMATVTVWKNSRSLEKQQKYGTTRYTYDSMNRLAKVEYPDRKEELFYDKAGNRTKRVMNGMEELYRYDKRNRLTEYTKGGTAHAFSYDNAGNLIRDDRAKYEYDAFNRNTKVETFNGNIQINHYDAEGLRHEMEENGRLISFIFRGTEVVTEETQEDRIRYIRTNELLASDAESARTYYHYASDEIGNITHVVNDTNVINHYEYDVWGNLTVCEETVENRFKYNGQQFDPISQQYYLRARYYNPVIGRFTQEDTYRGDGLNLYAYCRNNPVFYIDPSGHMCEKGVDRVTGEINTRTATKDDVKNLSSHIREKLRNGGTLTDQECRVANQLGIDVGRKSGRYSVGDATFMDANDAFVSNISRRVDVDANGYFDVIAHGTPNGIQITHNGQHMIVDHRTATRLIQNSDGYNGQAIRLLSCNTGALDNGFAQNLANRLNVEVLAPTNYLWSTPNGNYFVAGMTNSRVPDMGDIGSFRLFLPGGNQ